MNKHADRVRRAALLLFLLCLLCFSVSCRRSTDTDAPCLYYRGVDVCIGMEADALLAQLGEDYVLSAAPSCAGVGEDRLYEYPSLRLYVFAPAGGLAQVTSVCYTDDGAATRQGVTIGQTAQQVIDAYGKPQRQTDTQICYTASDRTLVFTLRDGRVTGIALTGQQ